jgi:chemotaxis protein MotB
MARKEQAEEQVDGGAWLVTYSDLVTLLLVFFVVLYAMANTDLKNFRQIAESLRVAFNGVGDPQSTAIVGESKSVTSPSMSAAPLFFENLPPKRRDFIRVSTELTTLAKQLGVEGDISVNMNMEGIIISLSEKLVYEPGSAELRPEALEVLDEVAKLLEPIDNGVRVEGHTDNIPTNSPLYPTNWELSVARAVSVVRYLIEGGGIAPERLLAAGNAEYKPLVPNDNRANRALNRRADIVIIYPTDSRQFSITLPGSQNSTPETADTEQ